MADFTKGPWEASSDGSRVTTSDVADKERTHGYGCGNYHICSLNDGEYHQYSDLSEQLDIANLIAAAPDMFKALELKLAYEAMPEDRGGKNGAKGRSKLAYDDAAYAALAKARGKT